MDKLSGKKSIAGKKKEPSSDKKKKQCSENKIRIVKKMSGGEPTYKLNHNLTNYKDFIDTEFKNTNNKNYRGVKISIISEINELINNNSNEDKNNLFYIYEKDNIENIISIGVINSYPLLIKGKIYLYILYLLSIKKGNRGGINAIYHLLSSSHLSEKYAGICLNSSLSAISFYEHLGFYRNNKDKDMFIFDRENIRNLEAKLPHPITTEFHSMYPL